MKKKRKKKLSMGSVKAAARQCRTVSELDTALSKLLPKALMAQVRPLLHNRGAVEDLLRRRTGYANITDGIEAIYDAKGGKHRG